MCLSHRKVPVFYVSFHCLQSPVFLSDHLNRMSYQRMSVLHVGCTSACENLVSANRARPRRVTRHGPRRSCGRAGRTESVLCFPSAIFHCSVTFTSSFTKQTSVQLSAPRCHRPPRPPVTVASPHLTITALNHLSVCLATASPFPQIHGFKSQPSLDLLTPASCPDTDPHPCPCLA